MQNMTKVEWALNLAERGFLIFPVEPGAKTPYPGVSWTKIMTSDGDTIREWFIERPTMNYGVCPGIGNVIVDLDKKDVDGVEKFFALEAEQDAADRVQGTLTVQSPSGGLHLYLSILYAVSNAHSFGDGIDVRGSGGYVVGPGCVLKGGGEYKLLSGSEIYSVPSWIEEKLGVRREKDDNSQEPLVELDLPSAISQAREYLKVREPAIQGHNGDVHTFITFCELKDLGISEEKSVELVIEPIFDDGDSWNDICVPSWNITGPQSLETKAYSAHRSGQNQPGEKAEQLMANPEFDIPVEDMDATVARFESKEKLRKEVADDAAISDILDHMYTDTEITQRTVQREMVIHEWLPAHGFTALLAARGRGKTVTMTDMALNLACDMDWYGLPTDRKWTSIYLCGEDDLGYQDQVTAWIKHNGVKPTKGRLRSFDTVFNLLDTNNVNNWIKALKAVIGDKRAVVFVDTWQRAAAHGGQNSDEDMQKALHNAEAFARALNGPAVVAFHPPKDGRSVILGSSVLENSTTAIWELTNHAAGKKLEVTRMKGRGEGNYRLFRFEEVSLGEKGQFGKDRIGIVPVSAGGKEDEASGVFSERDERWRVALCDAIRAVHALSANEEKRPNLTPHHVGLQMEQLKKDNPDHPAIFGLEEVEYTSFGHRTVENEIGKLIVERGLEHPYDDRQAVLRVLKNNPKANGGTLFEIAPIDREHLPEEDEGIELG